MATNLKKPLRSGSAGTRLGRILIALLSLATAGCVGQGLLYTRVVDPYSTDFHATSVGGKTCRVNELILREPASGANVSVSFTLRLIEEAAREAGMTNLYYADIETLSVLQGIYETRTLILYGD